MKRLLLVILPLVLVLVAVATGCGDAHRYDRRLIAADSLMLSAPDSALALLSPICGDSLPSDGDRAYCALLLTQARYKCYEKITATDDSAITLAMDYYRTHDGEREKLTRAYLYKGAVMEELAHVDSAMLYYKTAEAVADEKDYFTLGYVNMRMGALYRDHFSFDGKSLEKYEAAYEYLEHTKDKHYQLMCRINLGSLYRLSNPTRAENILKEAMPLAQDLKDTTAYIACIESLITMYDHYKRFSTAKRLINHTMEYPLDKTRSQCLKSAAHVYAMLGMPDSAEFFLSLADLKGESGVIERVSQLECLSAIALARGDSLKHLEYEYRIKRITDSIKARQEAMPILKSEHAFDQSTIEDMKVNHKQTVYWLIVIGILLLMLLAAIHNRRMHRYDHIIADFKQQSASQLNDLSVLKQNIDKLHIQDDQLKSFISNHLNMMREMIEACYHSPRSALSRDIRRIVEFQNDNNDSWEKLYGYMDIKYNNIMTETRRNYPQLNSRELLLLALTCLGCSCAQIAIISGYANATTISGNRQRLAKKMGFNGSVKQYTERFINSAE